MEVLYPRCCGLDVHQSSITACVLLAQAGKPLNDALMKLAKARKLDAIVVWKLDRFGRSLRHLVNALTELGLSMHVCEHHRQHRSGHATGQAYVPYHRAMSEFEREPIRERVLSGLADAKAQGKRLGRPTVHRDRDRDAKQIRAMRDAGDSYEEIAAELGRSKSDVYRVCQTLGCMRAS